MSDVAAAMVVVVVVVIVAVVEAAAGALEWQYYMNPDYKLYRSMIIITNEDITIYPGSSLRVKSGRRFLWCQSGIQMKTSRLSTQILSTRQFHISRCTTMLHFKYAAFLQVFTIIR